MRLGHVAYINGERAMRWMSFLVLFLLAAALFGCSGRESEPRGGSAGESASEVKHDASPSPNAHAVPELAVLGESIVVPATANIYGAGLDEPLPAGGGGGTAPPGWQLSDEAPRSIAFESVAGRVKPIIEYESDNGPEGTKSFRTDIESLGGISGIVHRHRQMFVVGVFLTSAPPSRPAPPRLDFTNPRRVDLIAPRIGQVFLVGDGKSYRYTVPPMASRLFLGFADGYFGEGSPSYYGNNGGEIEASVAPAKG